MKIEEKNPCDIVEEVFKYLIEQPEDKQSLELMSMVLGYEKASIKLAIDILIIEELLVANKKKKYYGMLTDKIEYLVNRNNKFAKALLNEALEDE